MVKNVFNSIKIFIRINAKFPRLKILGVFDTSVRVNMEFPLI